MEFGEGVMIVLIDRFGGGVVGIDGGNGGVFWSVFLSVGYWSFKMFMIVFIIFMGRKSGLLGIGVVQEILLQGV